MRSGRSKKKFTSRIAENKKKTFQPFFWRIIKERIHGYYVVNKPWILKLWKVNIFFLKRFDWLHYFILKKKSNLSLSFTKLLQENPRANHFANSRARKKKKIIIHVHSSEKRQTAAPPESAPPHQKIHSSAFFSPRAD